MNRGRHGSRPITKHAPIKHMAIPKGVERPGIATKQNGNANRISSMAEPRPLSDCFNSASVSDLPSTSGNRNDGAGRLVRVGWPFNCNSCLGLHWSDLCVSLWRFPEAIGFLPAMKIDFTALTRPIPVPAMQPLCGAYLGFGIFLAAFHITSS